MPDITPADIQAMHDVLVDIAERSDKIDAEDAVVYVHRLFQLEELSRKARSVLETQAVNGLKGKVKLDRRLYEVADNVKRRDDHDLIEAVAADYGTLDKIHGVVVTDPYEVARRVTRIMRQLYVSDSTTARKTTLHQLDIPHAAVEDKVEGRKLKVTHLKEETL